MLTVLFPSRWRMAFLLGCWLLLSAAFAAPTSPLRFQHLSALGADQLSTLCLIQDRQGFVWIGTNNDGLYRFDGYQSQKFQNLPNNARSLPHDRVSALFEDAHGALWVGTQSGLARFDPASGDFTRFNAGATPGPQRIIKTIISDGKDGLWLATWGGLQHFDPASGSFTSYVHDAADPASLASNDLNALVRDEHGGLWAATWPGGLDYLAPGAKNFEHHRLDSPAAPDAKINIVRALFYDARHQLWAGTENGVVVWQEGSDWSSHHRLPSPASRVTRIYADRNQSVWIATLSAGLLNWDDAAQQFTPFLYRANDPNSIPSNDIRAILHDRSGMLWVASFTDGIALANLNSRGFVRYIPFDADAQNPQPNNSLQRIDGAPGGKLWISGNSGVGLFDPADGRVLRQYRAEAGRTGALSSNIAYSLYQQPGGPLWVGTSAGLNRLNGPDAGFTLQHFGSVADDFINIIAPGSEGALWLGTGNSLVHYTPADGKYQAYAPEPGNPASRSARGTTAILQDREGRVWAGAEWNGGGLDLLDVASGRFRHFVNVPGDPASLSDDNVAAIFQDAAGRLWVGTAKGLNEIVADEKGALRFRRFTGRDSVGEVRIVAITADDAGKLWLATVNGLLRFDTGTGSAERYTASDGLTEGLAGAVYRSPQGIVYFGGIKGMTAVHPEQVNRSSLPPQVAITDISVFNQSLKSGPRLLGVELQGPVTAPSSLTLSLRQSVFSIEFAALHFTDPKQSRYRYRLEGFDHDWVETDSAHRLASYTNLDPGNYTFQVKAGNDQGLWSEQAAELAVVILPAFWQTAWFRFVAIVLVCGLLLLAYHRRITRLTRRREELEALVAARLQQLQEQQQVNRDGAERMQAVLQNAADAILTTDDQWFIESCNRAGLEIYRCALSQLQGQAFSTLVGGGHPHVLQQAIEGSVFREKGQLDLEMQLLRANGQAFPAEVSLSAFRDRGQTKYIVIVRDITERKKAERIKTEFVSTVSHELRTPLTSIRGSLGLMVGGVAGALSDKAAGLGRIALANAERLTRLIDDLLDVQKMEAGMMDFAFRTLPLQQLLADAVEAHQAFAQRLDVRLLLAADIPHVALRVDADRFAQVMANLLSNACKYSAPGQQVEVCASFAQADHRRVRIAVIDHGKGVPEEFKARIFQKFSQADSTDTRAKGGTGLGLAIAREMVLQMQGEIGFYSEADVQTVFFIEFPVVAPS